MIWAVLVLSLAALGFAGTTVALALKRAKLVTKLARVTNDRNKYREGLHTLKNELQNRELMSSRDISVLRARADACRERINALPESDITRDLVRHELDRLLSGQEGGNDSRH